MVKYLILHELLTLHHAKKFTPLGMKSYCSALVLLSQSHSCKMFLCTPKYFKAPQVV